MKTFPMFLKMEDRKVVIVGGGEQAAQKCRLLLKTDAEVTVIANVLESELEGLERSSQIHHVSFDFGAETIGDAALLFVATGCKGADASWYGISKSKGVLTNVVDNPDLCDAYTPSIVDRDPVVVAIGTEGTAPVLGRHIKSQIEKMLEPRLGQLARIAGNLRGAVAQRVRLQRRREFWRWVFADAPRKLFAGGSERDAIALIKGAIVKGGAPNAPKKAFYYTVSADPVDPDLMSLRDVAHLQESDLIYYRHQSYAPILEYARRDAERHCIDAFVTEEELDNLAENARARGNNVVVVRPRQNYSNIINLSRVLRISE